MGMKISELLPNMLSGEELKNALRYTPEYDVNIRCESSASRLMRLNDLYEIYLPSEMSAEIYYKLYLAMLRSLQKKESKIAVQQRYENFRAIQQRNGNGIIGGSDSFTVIGTPGIGKSSAVDRAIQLISGNSIIEVENPYVKIVPFLSVQCPFDCSVKNLLLEILRKTDEILGSKYYENALRARATTDMLIGSVSQVALNSIGLLVVDEIQNVCNHKNGGNLVAVLTQLINSSGISICMVGTPECTPFFEKAMHLARRTLGLSYGSLDFDEYFRGFCKTIFKYQFVKQKTEVSDSIINWLYEHSGGIISNVISLLHDAQEIAILSGEETLGLTSLNQAYEKRMSMLHDYMRSSIKTNSQTGNIKNKKSSTQTDKNIITKPDDEKSIIEMAKKAKRENIPLLKFLKESFSVTEVSV